MTAYLSANLRHTDKRLQQSGPAVVALRHRVRARRGSRFMNIYEVGGDMTSCSLCTLLGLFAWQTLFTGLIYTFSMYISSFTLLYAYSVIIYTLIHKHNNRCWLLSPKRMHIAGIIRALCASRQAKGMKIAIIKIETQINHLHTQLYSNDPPKAEKQQKRSVWSLPILYMHIPFYKTKHNHTRQIQAAFLSCVL